jgi:Delta6-protoilludene synthase
MVTFPKVYLPDVLAKWPWPRMLNQHYGEVKPISDAWLRSFEAFDVSSQKAFDKCNFG